MGKDWAIAGAVAVPAGSGLGEAGSGSRSKSGRGIEAWVESSRLNLASLGQVQVCLVTGSFVVA